MDNMFRIYTLRPKKIWNVDIEKYIIRASENFLEYSFHSNGPNGSIKKIVVFTLYNFWGYEYYNLSLCNWNESKKIMDGTIISNNQDTEKVLGSVAHIIIDFSDRHPETFIGIEASMEARLRLYKMKINKYLNEIETYFELFGMMDDSGLIPYTPDIKCLGFVGRKKRK